MNPRIIILENTFYTVLSLRMEIMSCLKDNGYEVYVLSTGPEEDRQVLRERGYQVMEVGSVVVNPFKAIRFLLNLRKAIRDIHPRLVFSFTIRPNIFGSIVCRTLGIPIVSNVTGTGPLTEDNSILYRTIRLLYHFAFLKNQRVFFQNEDDLNFFLSHHYVKPEQAKLLPGSGVDTDYFAPILKTEKEFSFLMISRLIKDKGVLDYIEAAKLIQVEHRHIKFKILGPFWTQSIGKNTIRKDEISSWEKEGIIQYLGYTLDVRPYIAEADCIVLPSYREGCANVLMQGASMSKPLVATSVTGCRNLIEDGKTGLLCEVRNSQDLADKLIQIYNMNEEERKEMGAKGRNKMIEEYRKSFVLDAYLNELKDSNSSLNISV